MVVAPTTIIRRQVEIDFDSVPPGPWFPAGGPLETMFNAASISFPPAERFFMASVAAYRDRIKDQGLREQVQGFMHQEAMHNRLHIAFNAQLARSNPGCRRAERVSEIAFGFFSRAPRSFRLSLSSALEHFTSMAADCLLHYPNEFRSVMPAPVAEMWLWHAIEETEHKSVCIDVYRAVLGTGPLAYLNRILGMLVATPMFLLVMLVIGAAVLGGKRNAQPSASPSVPDVPVDLEVDPVAADRFVGRSMAGLLFELIPWRQYFSYYRPSFHPWDYDNSHFVTAWRTSRPDEGFRPASRRPAGNSSAI